MSNRTYVCIRCRLADRKITNYSLINDYSCRKCGGEVQQLPWEWRIPKKNDSRGWKEFEKVIGKRKEWLKPVLIRYTKDQIYKLIKRIDGLESKKSITKFQEPLLKSYKSDLENEIKKLDKIK